MGKFLHTLGTKMFSLSWWVVAAWVVLLGLTSVAAVNFAGETTTTISIPGTKAQQTLDRFNELFPDAGAQVGRVVVATTNDTAVSDYKTEIIALTQKLAAINNVSAAISPFDNPAALSKDGKIAYITVQLQAQDGVVSKDTIAAVQGEIAHARSDNLVIESGGDLAQKGLGEIIGAGEVAGLVIALVVLVATLGSLVAAGMPIIIALVTVGVSITALFSLSQVIELTSTAPVLAIMLGLAVGIDYSLFIINRYRTFVKEGYALKEAAGRAIATAGNAVIFAAVTVVIALASLAVVQIPFMTTMGLAAAATVAIAAVAAITMIPAILGIVGLRVFGKKARKEVVETQSSHEVHEQRVSHKTVWYHWAEALVRYRKRILAGALLVIIALALPVTQLNLGLPTDETAAPASSERKAYELIDQGFGPGFNGPLLVVVEGLPPAPSSEGLDARSAAYAQYYELQQVASRIAQLDTVASAQAALVTDSGTKGVIQVTPKTGPSEGQTAELVTYLRDEQHQKELAPQTGVTFGVTGTTAIQIDINAKLAQALPLYLGVVIGLSFILLLIAFRSVLIPIKATLGFLLSVLAMFGALVAVFQWGWFGITDTPGPIVSFIPIIAIGILFGLAMDYEFFLVSSMQEAYHQTKQAKQAVVRGFAIGSRVVVAAALIMVAVFAGFITNHDPTIQSIGFALALGIFVDAFIVRMTIVPIVMSFLGKGAWWLPKWLDTILPHVSIEGEAEDKK